MQSKSLFDTLPNRTQTEAECLWNQQVQRRRRRMRKLVLVVGVVAVVVAAWGIWAANRARQRQIQEFRQAEEQQKNALSKKGPECYGTETPSIRFVLMDGAEFGFVEPYKSLLVAASDAKPATIRTELWRKSQLPEENPCKKPDQAFLKVVWEGTKQEKIWDLSVQKWDRQSFRTYVNQVYAQVFPERGRVFSEEKIQQDVQRVEKYQKQKATMGVIPEDPQEKQEKIELTIPRLESSGAAGE